MPHKVELVELAAIEATKLALVYASDELERDLEVIGDVALTLYTATDAPDTDFITAKLCLVDPSGRSTNVLEGIVRASHRDPRDAPTPVVPGQIAEYRIELGPVGIRVPAGYRLRVHVASSDFPQFDRNLNTGGPFGREGPTAVRPATQVVVHNARHPSRLTLPVVRS